MALASDRLKEAFDLILAHFTQKISPDLMDKVINKGKQQFSHIQFDADEIDMFLSISKKLISQERTTLRKLNKIESNLNSTKVKIGIQEVEEEKVEPLAGFGPIESFDFKREQLLGEINNKAFKVSTFFAKKSSLTFKQQEKPQMFNKPTDIVNSKVKTKNEEAKSMERSASARSWTDVMQVDNQK